VTLAHQSMLTVVIGKSGLPCPDRGEIRRHMSRGGDIKAAPLAVFGGGDLFTLQSNGENYQRRMPVGHLFAAGCR
jgi:hypothetical protein